MIYPLVLELAAVGTPVRVPVAVTCRILGIAGQPFYRWLAQPITDVEWGEALIANAAFDAHQDDPEFGYRFIADEVRAAGIKVCNRTIWRVCADNGWWSTFGKKKGKGGKKPWPTGPRRQSATELRRRCSRRALVGRYHRASDR